MVGSSVGFDTRTGTALPERWKARRYGTSAVGPAFEIARPGNHRTPGTYQDASINHAEEAWY